MIKFTSDIKDTFPELVEQHLLRLRRTGYITMDFQKVKELRNSDLLIQQSIFEQAERVLYNETGGDFMYVTESSILTYLMDFKNVPDSTFRKANVKKESLDMSKVLKPLYDRGVARDFLGYYMKYKSLFSRTNFMKGLLNKMTIDGLVDRNGNQLGKVNFKVNETANRRFNYSSEAIVNIPKGKYTDCIVAEEGKILASADFEQADLRIAYNLFIRNSTNAKIMDSCLDKYEGMARIVYDYYKKPFNIDKFKVERTLYKVLCLAVIYGKSTAKTKEEREFVDMFGGFLLSCPKFVAFKQRIERLVDLGLAVDISSYFGDVTTIPYVTYNKHKMINKALNTPMQTGTSEVVILTANAILNKFYGLGYTEDDISIYYQRHDELVFIMNRNVMKDSWIFKECSSVLIDNWTPMELKFIFGYHYSEEDAKLMDSYTKSIEDNKDKITMLSIGGDDDVEEFYPVSKVISISISTTETEDNKAFIAISDNDTVRASFRSVDIEEQVNEALCFGPKGSSEFQLKLNELLLPIYESALKDILKESSTFLNKEGINYVKIFNGFAEATEFIGNVYFDISKWNNPSQFGRAQTFVDIAAVKYSKANNLTYDDTRVLNNLHIAQDMEPFVEFE